MPTPLTAPSRDSFDSTTNRTRVQVVGDRVARDWEFNESQQLQEHLRRRFGQQVFRHGAIVAEAGGTVGECRQGIATADIEGTSGGTYRGFVSTQYTLTVEIMNMGKVFLAVRWTDDPSTMRYLQIASTDPLDGSVAYAVGDVGVTIAFTGPGPFVVGDSWLIAC